MHISKLTIKNFRRVGKIPLCIEFKGGLNIIVGENNAGKTTVADAMALVLGYGSAERSGPQLQATDFNDRSLPIEVDLEFSELSEEQESAFIDALDISGPKSKLKFQFKWQLRESKALPEITCGEHATSSRPYDLLAHLNCHYLRALRDVSQEFKPGARNRIGKMLAKLFKDIDSTEKERFLKIFRDAESAALSFNSEKQDEATRPDQTQISSELKVESNSRQGPIAKLETSSNILIKKLQFVHDDNSIVLGLHERELVDILHTVFPKSTSNQLHLSLNGLGYNNLIYIAVLLTEIEALVDPREFICLIVEEPEAHLHPQLQSLLLAFLRTNYANVQVIVTSHSPSFIADSELDDLIVLCRSEVNDAKGIRVGSLGLGDKTKRFIRKFVDVTKSQFFFSRSIVFVEGYTEALLIRSFWDSYFAAESAKFHNNSIEVVNINGVAFEHYVELVSKVFKSTGVRCVVLSDDDRGTGKEVLEAEKIDPSRDIASLLAAWPKCTESSRCRALRQQVEALKTEGCQIELFVARRTFEIEFALCNSGSKWVKDRIASASPTPGSAQGNADSEEAKLQVAFDLWKRVVQADDKTGFALDILEQIERPDSEEHLLPPLHFKLAFEYLNGKAATRTAN